MARRSGMYKGDKRRKELKRMKKQEEKRQMRLDKAKKASQQCVETEPGGIQPDSSEDAYGPEGSTKDTAPAAE